MSIIDRTAHVPAWPNLTQAAKIIGISPATLSRDPDVSGIEAGRRDKRFSPSDVLDRAAFYKRRSLNEVAQALVDHARAHRPELADGVEDEVEEFFAERPVTPTDKRAFMADLERVLPPELFAKVRYVYEVADGHQPGDVVSNVTDEDEAAGG